MKLMDLKCISDNINIEDYYKLYNDVRDSMDNPSFLGVIPENETIEILKSGGKIWMYYDKNIPVASVFYLPVIDSTLRKHNVNTSYKETGSLGPIMVRKEYVGNNFMNDMIKTLEDYCRSINIKYVFTKAAKDNLYSIRNIQKNGYEIIDEYENERGKNLAFIKKL